MSSAAVTAVVPADLDGVRADRAVAVIFDVTRAVARRLVETGDVHDAGRTLTPAQRLTAGTVLTATLPEPQPALVPAAVAFGVVFEDEAVIVVAKPAGLVVHPGAGTPEPTLVAGLVHRFPDLAGLEQHRWGLVHRLDRDTSGLLVVARSVSAFDRLQEELRLRRIERSYLALVEGTPDGGRGTVDAPIGRDPHHPTRMALVRDGRPARTHFRRLAAWSDATLLDVQLETGRTHQIRVHLASIGHPVVGDRMYGGRRGRHRADAGRQWLHAARLAFAHPVDGRSIEVTSSPPEDLRAAIAGLGEPDAGAVPDWDAPSRA